MKVQLSIVILAVLQLGLPTGAANENQGHLRRGDSENEDLEPEQAGRELFGFPLARPRPGQSRRGYGSGSLLGFRSYTNSDPLTSSVQQGIPLSSATQPQPLAPVKGSKSSKAGGFVRPINKRAPVPGTIPKRADGSFDGNFVVGVPRTGSLSQALGFYKVEQGQQVIFVQDENDDDAVVAAAAAAAEAAAAALLTEEPTISPAPTITPQPTRQPTINPTKNPTPEPTLPPTPEPTINPTFKPTQDPTRSPTRSPTRRPSRNPTNRPTRPPTRSPTLRPTNAAAF